MYDDFQKQLAAYCVWKEARGEGDEGMRAVLHVISNRAIKWKRDWVSIIMEPLQFTSMTYTHDPEIGKTPRNDEEQKELQHCYDLACLVFSGQDPDITNSATHYFNPHVARPTWALTMLKVATIGHHDFYR